MWKTQISKTDSLFPHLNYVVHCAFCRSRASVQTVETRMSALFEVGAISLMALMSLLEALDVFRNTKFKAMGTVHTKQSNWMFQVVTLKDSWMVFLRNPINWEPGWRGFSRGKIATVVFKWGLGWRKAFKCLLHKWNLPVLKQSVMMR